MGGAAEPLRGQPPPPALGSDSRAAVGNQEPSRMKCTLPVGWKPSCPSGGQCSRNRAKLLEPQRVLGCWGQERHCSGPGQGMAWTRLPPLQTHAVPVTWGAGWRWAGDPVSGTPGFWRSRRGAVTALGRGCGHAEAPGPQGPPTPASASWPGSPWEPRLLGPAARQTLPRGRPPGREPGPSLPVPSLSSPQCLAGCERGSGDPSLAPPPCSRPHWCWDT